METQLSTSFYCLNLERYQRFLPFCRPSRNSFSCIITDEQFRSDIFLSTSNNILNIIELTVRFETNIDNNATRKYEKYRSLIQELSSSYHRVKYIDIAISSLGIFVNSCDAYIQKYKDLNCKESILNISSRN